MLRAKAVRILEDFDEFMPIVDTQKSTFRKQAQTTFLMLNTTIFLEFAEKLTSQLRSRESYVEMSLTTSTGDFWAKNIDQFIQFGRMEARTLKEKGVWKVEKSLISQLPFSVPFYSVSPRIKSFYL